MNQHILKENISKNPTRNVSLSKIGHDFKWQGVSKLIFLDEIFFEKIRFNFSLKIDFESTILALFDKP